MLIQPKDFARHPPLAVLDGTDLLHIEFEDLLKYHGLGSIGGVAIAFRVMGAALARLSPGHALERRSISILTAFGGPGAADAFEMVTRGRSENRYRVDVELDAPEAAPAARGRYFFQFSTPTGACALGLLEGVVFPEFTHLVQQSARSPLDAAQSARLKALKFLLAQRVLALPEKQLLTPVQTVEHPFAA